MTEKPILFSGPMVRAILDGRKTQTRRVIKLPTKNIYEHPKMGGWAPTTIGGNDGSFHIVKGEKVATQEQVCIWHQTCGVCIAVPFQVGTELWVREAWTPLGELSECTGPDDILYRATATEAGKAITNWRPSIHMPRWASRITLRVTAVKVERLQSISEEDALAEGVGMIDPHDPPGLLRDTYAEMYRDLWNSINGPGSWDANPWVAAYSFERVLPK